MNIEKFHKEIGQLLEAKSLLDKLLSRYDPYSGEFDISEYDKSYSQYSLLSDIRNYMKFDDSE